MSTMIRLFILTAFAFALNSAHTLAQDNNACDAACNVPCYFGECAPAKASYDDALQRCDVSRLDLVAQLYGGTASGSKAREAASILRRQGYGVSGIGAIPNVSASVTSSCVALVDGTEPDNAVSDLCALVNAPSGFRCEVLGGRVELIALGTSAAAPVIQPSAQGCNGLIPPPGTRCELSSAGVPNFVTGAPSQPQYKTAPMENPDRVYGNGECLNYNLLNGPRTARISVGGAICIRGIPRISVRKSEGCKLFQAGGVEAEVGKIKLVYTGRVYSFETELGKVSFMASCVEAKTYNSIYLFRVFPG